MHMQKLVHANAGCSTGMPAYRLSAEQFVAHDSLCIMPAVRDYIGKIIANSQSFRPQQCAASEIQHTYPNSSMPNKSVC